MTPALLLADGLERTVFELGRIQSNVDWLLPVAVLAALAVFVVFVYRADCVELGPLKATVLVTLRMAAFVGLFIMYLQPGWRTEQEVVHPSRVILLVDTSLSMDLPSAAAQASNDPETAPDSRVAEVVAALEGGELLPELRSKHEVLVLKFDAETRRVANLARTNSPQAVTPVSVSPEPNTQIDWKAALTAQGGETRLGQAVRQVIQDEQMSPVAGIVVFSDGDLNAGIGYQAAAEAARESKLPLYTVGLGSERKPINVRVADFTAPARIHPGDSFAVTGYVQGEGLAGRDVTVELFSRGPDAAPNDPAAETLEASQTVTLPRDGEVVAVRLPLDGIDTPGRRVLEFKVRPPAEDRTPADNVQVADVEVVDQKTRVLLIAGGPGREYRFLRNQLFRDKEMQVDVWLQSGQPGMAQDAAKILEEFPTTKEELFAYDAIVAFDPDWRKLVDSQLELLEQWVAEQAGGLIVAAGPIHTDRWAHEPRLGKVRALYPVEFNERFSRFDDGRYGATQPRPPHWTREGLETEFLWVDDTAAGSAKAWEDFPGFYGYYTVRGPKPGATVYSYFSDPELPEDDPQTVFLAGQFFGAGRVVYMSSAEFWRLRAADEGFFERFYTKLIRNVSQGRLLRGSTRGNLLVERDRYNVGNSVVVKAQLTDVRLEPLTAPSVDLEVQLPSGKLQTVLLKPDDARPGMFSGQFTALEEGAYELSLVIPESQDERLSRRIQARVPDLEREHPERNDALLQALAQASGGQYYVGIDAMAGRTGLPPVWNQLKDMTRQTFVTGAPDPVWQRDWLRWLMIGITGVLCLEWLLRRLWRLA
jgi:hypothetical protein